MLSELQILATVTSHSNSALLAKNRPPAALQMVRFRNCVLLMARIAVSR